MRSITSVVRVLLSLAACLCALSAVGAENFHLSLSQVELSVPAGVNHLPVSVPVVAGSVDLNLSGVNATSDASWVTPTVNTGANIIRLSFNTATLTASSNTATITVSKGAESETLYVKATVAALNVVSLRDDPTRSVTYALHQNGTNLGALVFFDPASGVCTGCLTVGKKPSGMDIKPGGAELLVICYTGQNISVVDLANKVVTATIPLPEFTDCGDTNALARVAYGAGNFIYYTDGAWAPVMRVFDRGSSSIVQRLDFSGAVPGEGSASDGVGNFALSADRTSLYAFSLYGWSAGLASSQARRFTVGNDGKLTAAEKTYFTYTYEGSYLARDPVSTPVLISRDGTTVVIKQFIFSSGSISNPIGSVPAPVFSMSPGVEVVVSDSAIYGYPGGNKISTLPLASMPVQTVTSDCAWLVYFDPVAKQLKAADFKALAGVANLHLGVFPKNGSIAPGPTYIKWMPVAGVDSYNVYFGTSSAAVSAATTASAEYKGLVYGFQYDLGAPLVPGTAYYWRVDPVSNGVVTPGSVNSFTVSSIVPSVTSVSATTVAVCNNYSVSVGLSAASSKAWSASTQNAWITLVQSSGNTPSTLQFKLDATKMSLGANTGVVSITSSDGTFDLPVNASVDPVNLTVIQSDSASANVYAISEATNTAFSRAYLLEIDSSTESVKRAVAVGTSATDLAIHHGDNRIYVPCKALGKIYGVSLTDFSIEKTITVSPNGAFLNADPYRVIAGTTGRLIMEGSDQWIATRIYNTADGSMLCEASTSFYVGDGLSDPTGRYYYHASFSYPLQKYDTSGDAFVSVGSAGVSSYLGREGVVRSDDGTRIFCASQMFDQNLRSLWVIGDPIYCTSADGKYAFGLSKIYDTTQQNAIFGMPKFDSVVAFNSTARKLVYQSNGQIVYMPFTGTIAFTPPILSLKDYIYNTSLILSWTDQNLELGYTLQMRTAGTSTWTDVASTIGQNETSYTVSGLMTGNSYQFRIKADSLTVSSDWSNVLSVTMPSLTGAQTRNVTDITSLTNALTEANLNQDATFAINLAAGTYTMGASGFPVISNSHTLISGPTTLGSDAVIDCGAFSGDTVFDVTGDNVAISFITFRNLQSHGVTVRPGASTGAVAGCVFNCTGSNSAVVGTQCDDWVVFANEFTGIAGTSATAEPAVYFHGQMTNLEVSNNLFQNCDQAIAVGDSNDSSTGNLWIGNNMIADVRTSGHAAASAIHLQHLDVSPATVENNTVYQLGGAPYSIQTEYCGTNILVRNNLTNKPINNTGGSGQTQQTNNTSAQGSWFKDPTQCDLRLSGSISGVVDAGTVATDLAIDIEGDPRPTGRGYEIGADEYVSSSSSTSSGGSSSTISSGGGGGGGGGASSAYYFVGLVVLGIARRFFPRAQGKVF